MPGASLLLLACSFPYACSCCLVQLAPIYDHVAPCFPPNYRIFGVICAEHHRQLSSMIDFIGLCAENLANADILKASCRGGMGRVCVYCLLAFPG